MAKITLRAYIQEIERLIDDKRIEEALAHCHHILQFYPKNIEIYRLLGKAYLEQQSYGNAADIFQRVLSSLPDDFVAHVGMSIVREDEGNLDEALWHMERAFEVQPSNTAIQEEMRRLYGRRDGMEPLKIRLTRGALARMYAKGELYQQATMEIRAALAEDPKRVDLQILLARIYAKTGKLADAVDLSKSVLRKLPNSLEANRILAAAISGSDHEAEAKGYRHNLSEIDPYVAFATISGSSLDQVPDQAVILEKLAWKPESNIKGKAGQPDWAASLGLQFVESETPKEDLPDWLKGEPPADPLDPTQSRKLAGLETHTEPGSSEQAESPELVSDDVELTIMDIPDDEKIPDWMKSAGWEASDQPESFADSDTNASDSAHPDQPDDESELVAAEIPDWLKEIAPTDEFTIDKEGAIDAEVLPWLDQILPPSDNASAGEDSEPTIEDFESPEKLPEWLSAEESPLDHDPDQEIPDWLAITDEEQPEETTAELEGQLEPEAQAQAAEAIPDWLAITDEEQPEETTVELEGQLEPEAPAEAAEAIPDWLAITDEEQPEETTAELEEQLEPEAPAEAAEAIPDWLAITDEELPEEVAEELEEQLEPEAPAEAAEATPDWPEPESPQPAAGVIEAETDAEEEIPLATDIPEWLHRLEEPEINPEDTRPSLSRLAGKDGLYTSETQPEDTESQAGQVFEGQGQIDQSHDDLTGLSEEDDAFAWLESLAAQQRLDEAIGLPSDDSQEKPADWILASVEDEITPVGDVSTPTSPESEATIIEQMSEEDIEKGLSPTEFESPETAAPSEDEMAAAYAWLEGLAARQGADEGLVLEPEEQLEQVPEWIQEVTQGIELPTEIDEAGAIAQIIPSPPAGDDLTSSTVNIEIQPQIGEQSSTFIADETEDQKELLIDEITPQEPPGEAPIDVPELPSWLEGAEAASEEPLEWTPPIVQGLTPLNLNQASLGELERLPGLGFRLAQEIVNYREAHGPFTSLDDVLQVPGAEDINLTELKHYVFLEETIATEASEIPEISQELTSSQESPEIDAARLALSQGHVDLAIQHYTNQLKSGQYLLEMLSDLQDAVKFHPENIGVWQILGDTYLRINQVQQALDAYVKAEELLH